MKKLKKLKYRDKRFLPDSNKMLLLGQASGFQTRAICACSTGLFSEIRGGGRYIKGQACSNVSLK